MFGSRALPLGGMGRRDGERAGGWGLGLTDVDELVVGIDGRRGIGGD